MYIFYDRYWLSQHNPQCWGRIMYFMNRYIPSSEEVFKKFVSDRRWKKEREAYKHSLLASMCITNVFSKY